MELMTGGMFSLSNSSFDEAEYVLFGVPFDATTSFRPGSRFGPDHLRMMSWNLEEFILDLEIDVSQRRIHDMGNLPFYTRPEDVMNDVQETMRHLLINEKFPIMLGGEHSITPMALKAISDYYRSEGLGDVYAVFVDAHLDFRKDFLDNSYSHACALRRTSEILGMDNVLTVGVRSGSVDEFNDAVDQGLAYYTARELEESGFDIIADKLDSVMDRDNIGGIYLSIDLDGIDPRFAPGVGTPEPYGLADRDVRNLIERLSPQLIGMDVVELLPTSDEGGRTGALAGEFVRRAISLHDLRA